MEGAHKHCPKEKVKERKNENEGEENPSQHGTGGGGGKEVHGGIKMRALVLNMGGKVSQR